MPEPEHSARAGLSAYVLVLREHEEAGRGYSVELAPLPGGGAPPRAHGRSSTREAAAAAATTTGPTPRAGGGSMANDGTPTPRTRGRTRPTTLDTAMGGGATTGAYGDAEGGGGDPESPTGAARERILQDKRTFLFSSSQYGELPKNSDNEIKNISQDSKNMREVLIPIILSPRKKKGKKDKEDIWDKRQLIYSIALFGTLGFVPAVIAFLPPWMLFTFATIWGLGSVGFPIGLYGTYRLETGCSRHMARLVFMGFSLIVIYTMYRYMALNGTSLPSSSTPPDVSQPPTASSPSAPHNDMIWTGAFGFLGVIVMAGHIVSWIMGCVTGSDRDESSGEEDEDDLRTSDLLERLLDRR